MQLLVEQLDRRVAELSRWLEAEVGPPAEVRLVRDVGDEACLPDFDDRQAPVLAPDGDWREALNSTVWLRFRARRPDSWPVDDTALIAQRFGTYPIESERRIGLNLQRMQGMLYVDGRAYHGLDQYHRLIYLPPGPDYQCAASVWTGFADLDWQPNPVFRLVRTDPGVTQLFHDLRILGDALHTLAPTDPARPDLERIAESALLCIDWGCPGSRAFRDSCDRAHDLVERELAQLHSAPYEPRVVAAGHAHIDCAWLWPLSQTRQKAGRTWSTALRLMDRYPEYRFLASSPLQYEMVKECFPETFEGIRQRVAEGRWETVGGMWVEADCNLPDGESLARQMLLGTRYFEREFGVHTNVVWLPDTFGFTWALPTLMAGAGRMGAPCWRTSCVRRRSGQASTPPTTARCCPASCAAPGRGSRIAICTRMCWSRSASAMAAVGRRSTWWRPVDAWWTCRAFPTSRWAAPMTFSRASPRGWRIATMFQSGM